MWATIYQGRKMFQRTSEQGGMPADVVELLKMSVQTESDRDGWTNLHMVAGELHAVAAAFF